MKAMKSYAVALLSALGLATGPGGAIAITQSAGAASARKGPVGSVTALDVRRLWREGREVALLDAREEGPYSEAHPFFAVSVPLSQLELKIYDLVPRRAAPVVVYDDGEGYAAKAAFRLKKLGYLDVSLLSGGLAAYRAVGEVFRDVNVPSKAFGELVEAVNGTPMLSASDVKKLVDEKADVVVLDVRPFEEYRSMNIPTGISVPGADLTLHVFDMVRSPNTLVVVNCAGRTRSIVGTQTLVNLGLPNRVAALRNGTIGWTLAGYTLEQGQTRRAPEATPEGTTHARAAAERWAKRVGVSVITHATLRSWMADSNKRTLYRFDVRSPEEYEAGHPAGFLSAPGGQLVQATDRVGRRARRAHRVVRHRWRPRTDDGLLAGADGVGCRDRRSELADRREGRVRAPTAIAP